MKKRKLISLVLILTVSLGLAACNNATNDDQSESTNETGYTLAEDGKFTFAASGDFNPFSVTNAEGVMTGFDIDVAEAVAKELGLEPNQQKFKFASIIEGVKAGRFDAAVASHTVTPERQEQVNFSTPYYYSGPQIFTRPDSDIETLEDLKDKEIAVSKGSTYSEIAADVTDNVKIYDGDVTALEALSKGKHDAVITDFITGKEAIGNGLDIVGKKLLGRSEQAIAIGKDNEKLLKEINKALQTLRDNGTLKEISIKYFGEDITTKPE